MIPWIHAGFLFLWIGTFAFLTALAVVNFRYGTRKLLDQSDWFRDHFDVEPDRVIDYQRLKIGFGRLKVLIMTTGFLVVIYAGWIGDAARCLTELGLSGWSQGMVLVLGLLAVAWLGGIPFQLVDQFVIEELFEFNNQTLSGFINDQIRSLGVALVLGGSLLGAMVYLVQAFPTTWWLFGWGLFVGFSLLMQVLYPRVIAPLFNDFTPLEGELRDRVETLFEQAEVRCDQVFTMDASRRSGHSNAYFIGWGSTKRVVLYDTLMDHLTPDQIEGVLAHELGHYSRGHVWKQLGYGALQSGVVFAGLYGLVQTEWLYEAFWLPPESTIPGLLIGLAWILPAMTWVKPLINRLSLRHEREADDYAVEAVGKPEPLVEALYELAGNNLSNPFPHPAYAAFHHQHPPVPERARRLRDEVDESTDR